MYSIRGVVVVMAALFIAGCGGDSGSGFAGAPGSGGTGGGGGGGGGGSGTNPPADTVSMGQGTGSGFQAGMIAVGSTSLSAGGSTSLQVSLMRASGSLFAESVEVQFSSPCAAQGRAQIDAPVTTTTGIASTTYIASGCSGDDVITATAEVNGEFLSATGTVTVAPAAIGSIEFVSATPTNIGLKGTGGAGRLETSTVVFRVLDASGGARADADVAFALSSKLGGIGLSATEATSDANGRVQTVVQAGTVATSVRVTATVLDTAPAISTQSSQLTITTGIPDADSFSLSVECPNVEAWNRDGVVVPVTVRLSDRFNNPVPNGTAVTFTTEGGQIGGQCTTDSGACSVDWISSDPRPSNGRSGLYATAIGEESFTDNNGNGVFDDGDTFVDEGEPFLDINENKSHDPGEPFFDFNMSGTYDGPDGFYNGLLCGHTNLCSPDSDTTGIGQQNLIIMSGSTAHVTATPGALNVAGGPETVTFEVADLNGQPMPAGTTIALETTNGEILGPTSYNVPCTSDEIPIPYSFTLKADDASSTGPAFLNVTTPGGIITTVSIPVSD